MIRDNVPEKRLLTSVREQRKRMFAVLPSLLTLGNAVCGFASITFAAKVGPEVSVGNDLYYAALFIFAAMVFDALDGPVARLSRQTSDFGAHLDSLCDAISFGAAPAFLMLQFCRGLPIVPPRILWVIAVLYMLCAVLRLARFNVVTAAEPDHDFFKGLPSPAAAGMVASLVVIAPGLERKSEMGVTDAARNTAEMLQTWSANCLPFVTFAVACLMVSRVRYPHLFNQLFRGRRSFRHLVKLIFALVAIFAVHELAIPLCLFYFVLSAPLLAAWQKVSSKAIGRPPSSPPA